MVTRCPPSTHRRIPIDLVKRAEALALRRGGRDKRPPSQTSIIAEALALGLDALERRKARAA